MTGAIGKAKPAVRQSHFPGILCVVYFLALLLMSGIHMGLVTLINEKEWNDIVAVTIPTLYWALVAVGLTLYARWQIKKTYEEPMHRLAQATAKVAQGDFSVYVPPLHTADKLDYLDVMILDFNKMVEELGSCEFVCRMRKGAPGSWKKRERPENGLKPGFLGRKRPGKSGKSADFTT